MGSLRRAPPPPRPTTRPPPIPEDVTIEVPRTTLLRWNGAMALFHATLAAVTLGVGNVDLSVPTYKDALVFTEVANGSAWKLVPDKEEAGELRFTALVACFFLLSALFHAGNALLWRQYYLRELAACRTPTRWIEYFFSAAIMQTAIAYTLGVRDRSVLLAGAALVATTMPFGYWTETNARPLTPNEWTRSLAYRLFPWALGHVPQVTAWALILLQFYDGRRARGSEDRMPDFVHAILWGELVLFFSFGGAALWSQLGPPKRFYRGELLFQVLSLVSKGLLGILLLVNVLMLSRFDDIYED